MTYGQGSVKPTKADKNGQPLPGTNWRARYFGLDRKQHSKTFDRKIDATKFLTQMQASKNQGRWIDPDQGMTSFAKWGTEWLDSRHSLGEAALMRDRSLFANHVLPAFADKTLAGISASDVSAWVKDLVTHKGLSPRTVHACHRIFSSIMRAAIASRMIPDAPIGRGVVSLPRIERKPERILTELQLESLATEFDPFYRPLVYAGAYTGCRWQELAGLKRDFLDLDHRKLHVRGVLKHGERGVLRWVESPKSDAGRRTLTLPGRLVAILREHLSNAPSSEWVFPARFGGVLHDSRFRMDHWNPAVERGGFAGMTFHDLRHTHAAWLIRDGVQPLPLQRRLGHSDIRTTMNVYGHLFPNFEDDLVATLDRRWEEAEEANESAKVYPLNP